VAAYERPGEGRIKLPLVHPKMYPVVDFPLAPGQTR
jgi:hypothetical protein